MSWEIGISEQGKIAVANPQTLNSYAYSGNSPIINRDPDGRFWWREFYTDWSGYDVTLLGRDNGLILKAGEVLGGRSSAIRAISENRENIISASNRTGISQELIKGIIYEEQSHQFPPFGGEMILEGLKPEAFSGGLGVMQISSDTANISPNQLLDRKVNINAGADRLNEIENMGFKTHRDSATRYNSPMGSAHGQRYGARVDSYVTNKTYTSNFGRAINSVIETVRSVQSPKSQLSNSW